MREVDGHGLSSLGNDEPMEIPAAARAEDANLVGVHELGQAGSALECAFMSL
jgi:hypothetical protein